MTGTRQVIPFSDNPKAGTTLEYLNELFVDVANGFEKLADHDQKFASDFEEKLIKYKARILVSTKQFNWLQNIRKKANREDEEIDDDWNRGKPSPRQRY